MERCPTCQARIRDASVCPRCRTSLTKLLAIESDATAWLRQAVGRLAVGEEALALVAVENSLRLKREPLALLLRGFLLQRGQRDAWETLGQAGSRGQAANEETLPSTEFASENHATGGQLIDQVVNLAATVWKSMRLRLFNPPKNPPSQDG
ncbi:MAG: hypothetical protein NTX45_13355 [Proteobacteria bacterium]|nr:hypothetical protein [Pseudomonadota bacterium]